MIKINDTYTESRGWMNKLIEVHGKQQVFEFWYEHGIRKTGAHFGVSPWVIHYMATKFEWKRPAKKAPNIQKAVSSGKLSPDDFKTISFTNNNNAGNDTEPGAALETNNKKEESYNEL